MKLFSRLFLVVFGWLIHTVIIAETAVKVVLLGDDFAVVEINGEQVNLHTHEPAKNGVSLLAADSESATLQFDGQTHQLKLGAVQGLSESDKKLAKVRVEKDKAGMYRVLGKINDKEVHFLIDTGASTVVMNSTEAKNLGISLAHAPKQSVSTASQHTEAYLVKLDSISIGNITLNDVEALVMAGINPEEVLFGMSAIERLHLQHDGEVMYFEK